MNTTRPYKRKRLNLAIKRDMQFRMIGKISLILFLSQLLSGLIFYYFSNLEVTASFQMFHIKARNFLDFLLPVVAGSFLVSLMLGFLVSLFYPKTIVGGLYRIEEDLKTVIDQGDLSVQIILREGDQVLSVATKLNTLLSGMRNKLAIVKAGLAEAELIFNAESGQDQESQLRSLEKVHRQLKAQTDQFKV